MKIFNRDYRPDYEVTSGQRIIRTDGGKYDFLFPKSESKDTVVLEDGEVGDTIKVTEQVVWKYINDTKKAAELLRQPKMEDTLNAIWQFLYHNIQYQLDKPGLEELRRPARAWADRISGIDCDCFSIFCSSILTNMGIPHKFRITRYSQEHWQHIYVIVPKVKDRGYWTIDAVLGRFNYEKPYTQKMDYTMSLNGIKIAVLSGVEDNSPAAADTGRIVMNSMQLAAANNVALNAAIFGVDLQGLGILAGEEYLLGGVKDADIEKGLYRYLVATRQAIAENPMTSYIAGYNQQEIVKMLDYAIQYWFTDKRDQALGQLMNNEALLNQMNGFGNLEGIISDDDLYGDDDILTGDDDNLLGRAKKDKGKKKGFFKKVGEGLKKVGKGLMRFNPATIAARNGFLLALKLNIGKMSTRIKWAYATPQQAKAKGVSLATVAKAKGALEKIEKIFTKIGGKPDNLKKAILSGKKGKLDGLGQLGIIPVAAAVAAATPIITAVIKILKDSGLAKKDENIDISTTEGEAVADDGINFEDGGSTTQSLTVTDAGASLPQPAESVDGLGSIASGAIKFAQNNPMLGLAIGGAVAFGIYKLMDGGKEHESHEDHEAEHDEKHPVLAGPPKRGRPPNGKPPVFTLQ